MARAQVQIDFMGLYWPGGQNPALALHAWLGVEVRGSVDTCYLFDQGWAPKTTGSLYLLGR